MHIRKSCRAVQGKLQGVWGTDWMRERDALVEWDDLAAVLATYLKARGGA
jgi:hypothetical protein